jgi:antitoxin ParD1/3/4
MNVVLTPEMEKIVNQKVASGRYTSVEEVVQVALHLLEAQDYDPLPLDELRDEIARAEAQFARGEYKTYDRAGLQARFEAIRDEGLKRLEARRNATR